MLTIARTTVLLTCLLVAGGATAQVTEPKPQLLSPPAEPLKKFVLVGRTDLKAIAGHAYLHRQRR